MILILVRTMAKALDQNSENTLLRHDEIRIQNRYFGFYFRNNETKNPVFLCLLFVKKERNKRKKHTAKKVFSLWKKSYEHSIYNAKNEFMLEKQWKMNVKLPTESVQGACCASGGSGSPEFCFYNWEINKLLRCKLLAMKRANSAKNKTRTFSVQRGAEGRRPKIKKQELCPAFRYVVNVLCLNFWQVKTSNFYHILAFVDRNRLDIQFLHPQFYRHPLQELIWVE